MASIQKIQNKKGISYKITVAQGRDSDGKQIRHTTTWTPPQGMTARQAAKEVQKFAVDFEDLTRCTVDELEFVLRVDCDDAFFQ